MLKQKIYRLKHVLNDVLTNPDFFDDFGSYVLLKITVNGIDYDVITQSNLTSWLNNFYSWGWNSIEMSNLTDYTPDSYNFAAVFSEYITRKTLIIADYVAKIYAQKISPAYKQYHVTKFTHTPTNYGYSDTTYKYNIANTHLSKTHPVTVTINNNKLVLSPGTLTDGVKMQTKTTGKTAATSTNANAKQDTGVTIANDNVTPNAFTAGTDVVSSVQTGTFDSAVTDETPITGKTTNTGTNATKSENGSVSAAESTGESASDNSDISTFEHTETGTYTDETENFEIGSDFMTLFSQALQNDLTDMILSEFAQERLFYTGGFDNGHCYFL